VGGYGREADGPGFLACLIRWVIAYNSCICSVIVCFAMSERMFGRTEEQTLAPRLLIVVGSLAASIGMIGLLYLALRRIALWPIGQPSDGNWWGGIAWYLAMLSWAPFYFCVGLPLYRSIAESHGRRSQPEVTAPSTGPVTDTTVSLSDADFSMGDYSDPVEELRSRKLKLQFQFVNLSALEQIHLKDVEVVITVGNEPFRGGAPAFSPAFKAEHVRAVWKEWKWLETKEVEISSELGKGWRQVVLEGRAKAIKIRLGDGPAREVTCRIFASWTKR
jgi:hypothetical protein